MVGFAVRNEPTLALLEVPFTPDPFSTAYSYPANPLMARWPRFGCGGTIRSFADGNQTSDAEESTDETADEDFDGVILAEMNDELMLRQIEMPAIQIGNLGDTCGCEGAIHQMNAAGNSGSQQDRFNARDDIRGLAAVRASGQIKQDADGTASQEKGNHAERTLNDPWRRPRRRQ